jgi:acyl-coenzyme A synthetase/AMP-(fatty) acid ligase
MRDIEFRVNQAKAVMVITDEEGAAKVEAVRDRCPTLKAMVIVGGQRKGWQNFWEHVDEAPAQLARMPQTRSDDAMLLYFTSGTVSYPKMVMHTQASYAIGHIITATFWQDLKPTDLHWTLTDTGWAKAAWGSLGPWEPRSSITTARASLTPLKPSGSWSATASPHSVLRPPDTG